ncbi:MAG: branched-chain amino acid aminotransferase [Rhodospirillaceae bacterium]|nr:branched-chain amino acid aminotransferase [Alphaproteobacteria bacterium]MBR71793.1 branched-chain amino acid aminotransferase [Rhodospirillaceae bacterium]|tara:strand:+ start:3965 stop:4849 length:885 start_codon:yes stop_codon:yes gene_type:complete
MKTDPLIYINSQFIPLSEATISVLDQGFLLGDAVFDVVSAWKGNIFKLEDHLSRFEDSIRATRLTPSLDRNGWREAIIETVRRNNLKDASIRFIATRGVSQQVIADPRENKPTEIVWAAPYIFLADDNGRKNGIRLMISHLRGFPADTLDPRYKCVNRLHFQLAKIDALEAGYDDVIWLDQNGYVSEGPASNIFVVKQGKIFTPSEGILRGITRQTFVDLASQEGIEHRECQVSTFDLHTADEIFTTSTAGGALPIREVGGCKLKFEAPGPITKRLDEMYWKLRDSAEFGTPVY